MIPEYRNARYINDHGWVDCEVYHPEYGWVEFTLDPLDGNSIFDVRGLAEKMKENGDVETYVQPTEEELYERACLDVRAERDNLLVHFVDPIISNNLRFDSLPADVQQQWLTYRSDLLNITKQPNFPYKIDWPVVPQQR